MIPGEEIADITKMLDDRLTDSRINKSAMRAITSTKKILKRYHPKPPPNGLVIYTGTVVTDNGKDKDVAIDFEPYKPLKHHVRSLSDLFYIDSLSYLLEPEPKYGFIVMFDNKALIGMLSGNKKKVLFEEEVPRHLFHEGYLRIVEIYIDSIYHDVSGIVVAVSPPYQTALIDRLPPHLRWKIMCSVKVSYGGKFGFDSAISLSSNHLYNVSFIQEISLLTKFMKEMREETNTSVFGVEDTLKCLGLGAVKILIVWENLDINMSSELITKHLNKEQETDQSYFLDPGTNPELEVQEKKSLLEWFTEEYKKFGCTLELVTDSSREGSQFCRGFGGIGAMLKYQVKIQSFDNNLSDAGDQFDIRSFDDLPIDWENDAQCF